jgi:flagellin
MSVINTNVSATLTSNALAKNDRAMSQSMERLSTGQRINSASDDAAGLAIASKMTSQIRGLDQAVRNGNDAISMIQTADGAMVEVTNMLQRMREVAVQSASGTNTQSDRDALQVEFSALATQIQAVGNNTQWNGKEILDTSAVATTFQIGSNASQTLTHTFAQVETSGALGTSSVGARTDAGASASKYAVTALDTGTAVTFEKGDTLNFTIDSVAFSAEVTTVAAGKITGVTMHGSSSEIGAAGAVIASTALSGNITLKVDAGDSLVLEGTTTGVGADFTLAGLSVTRGLVAGTQTMSVASQSGSTNAIKTLDHALEKINSSRATAGAMINRLEYAVDNLANVSQNAAASRSRVQDANYATESTELARTQIIQQAGTAMLAQANQQSQSVLALLK